MTRTIALDTVLDEAPLSRAQYAVMALCALAMLIDAYDIYLVGSLGPAIAAHFGVAAVSLSSVFLLQQTGLAIGAFVISPISDRVGRKRVLLVSAAIFGGLTLLAIFARTLMEFALLRCATGFFLSGVVANAVALLVEAAPRRRRGVFVAIAYVGFGAGPACGALVGAFLVKSYGWQSGFWIAGVLPLLFVVLASLTMSESVQFLFRRNPADAAIARIVKRLRPDLRNEDLAFTLPERPEARLRGPRAVFAGRLALGTPLLWAVFFLAMGSLSLALSWLPTLFTTRSNITLGAYSAQAALAGIVTLFAGFLTGFLVDRFRATRVVMAVYLSLAVAMVALSHVLVSTPWFTVALTAVLLLFGAGQTAINFIAAQFYPVEARVTGYGWAVGAGRIGSIAGPYVGGLMIGAGLSVVQFFYGMIVPALSVVVFIICLGMVQRTIAAGPASDLAPALAR